MTLETHLREGEQALATTWKTSAVRGLLGIAFGVVLLAWPNIGLATLIALVAVFALTAGFTSFYAAVEAPLPRKRRAWLAVDGVLATAAGAAILIWPDLSARGLLFAVGAWAVASGAAELVLGAFALPLSGGRSLLLMLGGVVSTAFGVIMFIRPGTGAVALLALVASFAIVTGMVQIGYALELRRVAGELKNVFRLRPAPKPVTHG